MPDSEINMGFDGVKARLVDAQVQRANPGALLHRRDALSNPAVEILAEIFVLRGALRCSDRFVVCYPPFLSQTREPTTVLAVQLLSYSIAYGAMT